MIHDAFAAVATEPGIVFSDSNWPSNPVQTLNAMRGSGWHPFRHSTDGKETAEAKMLFIKRQCRRTSRGNRRAKTPN